MPVELVTASASGLDNNLTPAAVLWQVPRVAKARNLSDAQVKQLVDQGDAKTVAQFFSVNLW